MVQHLEDGFLTELADMLNAEQQILRMLPKMVQAAESRELRQALAGHQQETEEHTTRIEQVFKLFNRKPADEECEGIQGILKEGRELLEKTGPGPVRDAMIIAAAQKVEHYEVASYGTLCAWADELGEGRALRLLEETLNEERLADRKLSRIAESMTNERARDQQGGQERFRGMQRGGGDWHPSQRSQSQWNPDSERGRPFGGRDDRGMRGAEWEREYASSGMGNRGRNRSRSEE